MAPLVFIEEETSSDAIASFKLKQTRPAPTVYGVRKAVLQPEQTLFFLEITASIPPSLVLDSVKKNKRRHTTHTSVCGKPYVGVTLNGIGVLKCRPSDGYYVFTGRASCDHGIPSPPRQLSRIYSRHIVDPPHPRRFELGASNVCIVGENSTCSAPALWECEVL